MRRKRATEGGRSRLRAVREALEALDVAPARSRGQSFLADDSVAARQVMAAGVSPEDDVLEIGGGLGTLTRQLAARAGRVRVLEVEPSLAAHLERLRLGGVKVERADALAADLGRPDKVVANIPYSIASALIERLIDTRANTIVVMLQLELAKRLTASPGSKGWSRLGAIVGRDYGVDLVEVVPPNAFHPQPRVRSAVVRLRRRPEASARGFAPYKKVVGALFAQRRKKIRNTVSGAAAALGADPTRAVAAAETLGIADKRPEEIDCGTLDALAQLLAAQRTSK